MTVGEVCVGEKGVGGETVGGETVVVVEGGLGEEKVVESNGVQLWWSGRVWFFCWVTVPVVVAAVRR